MSKSSLRAEIARLADWHAQRIAVADSSRWTADDWEDFADATQRRLHDILDNSGVGIHVRARTDGGHAGWWCDLHEIFTGERGWCPVCEEEGA